MSVRQAATELPVLVALAALVVAFFVI